MEVSKLSHDHYVSIIKASMAAWDKADAELVASYYCDDLDYRDPSIPQGIKNKTDFIKYLKLLFKMWPSQKWVLEHAYPHENDSTFSAEYSFQIANDKATIRGCGMDLIIFKGDKTCVNHVYLNAVKWNDWVVSELKGAA